MGKVRFMVIFGIILFIALTAIDQITKFWARNFLAPIGSKKVIDGILSFTYVENRGAAWGILSGRTGLLAVVSIIAVIAIFIYFFTLPKGRGYSALRAALMLIASGAFGNFIDRVLFGFVTDFIEVTFINYPVFNFADICVCVGAGLFALLILFVIKDKGTE